MDIPFGPQLIGQVEKTLDAVLHQVIDGRLTEPQWVTLWLADLLEPQIGSSTELAHAVADRARYAEAPALVEGLTAAGLLGDGRLTDAGRSTVTAVQAEIAERTEPVWADLDPDDVAAATRALNTVLGRTRSLLT